jgi:hypothetical protein
MSKILYINSHAARYGWYFGRRLPKGYRLAAKFWSSGLIDRTKTLYAGFPYESLYPLPANVTNADPSGSTALSTLCDEMGTRIVREAMDANKKIQVLWSGGIDSTAALVGIIKAGSTLSCLEKYVRVLLSQESIEEYPDFYARFVKTLRHRFVTAPVTSHLDHTKLIVTGEHGDQIFGSARAAAYVTDGRAFLDYRVALPEILTEHLGTARDADILLEYIEPLFNACPIKLRTVFDAFWWINFSCKWQIVGLRLAVFHVQSVRRIFDAIRHYFTHPSFQAWSLLNHDKKIRDTWESYKMPLKDYIFEFTGDDNYRRTKIKVPSLKKIFIGDTMRRPPAYRVMMDETFEPVFWQFRKGSNETALRLPPENRGLRN